MRVVLSVDPVRFPLTGIGRYTYELARNLPRVVPGLDLQFMSGGRIVERLPSGERAANPALQSSLGVQLRLWAQNHSVAAVVAHRAWMSHRESRTLAGMPDVLFHGPQFYLPHHIGPTVVTIHDLSVYAWANCHPPGRVHVLQREIAKAVDRASMILTISEFTRREVIDYFALPPTKVCAIPLAGADCFHPRRPQELGSVLPRLGLLADRYCLYSGTIEPRKNIGVLLQAYGMLPAPMRRAYPLVLCGYHGWRSERLHKQIEKAEREGWARYIGYVSSDDLPYVVAGARLFAFPSLYEGFGLPVLEAMASGVPVVCSSSSSLPEVAGDAALMCEPEDVGQLSRLLRRGLEDGVWRECARLSGARRATKFSWEACAVATGEAYIAAWQ